VTGVQTCALPISGARRIPRIAATTAGEPARTGAAGTDPEVLRQHDADPDRRTRGDLPDARVPVTRTHARIPAQPAHRVTTTPDFRRRPGGWAPRRIV